MVTWTSLYCVLNIYIGEIFPGYFSAFFTMTSWSRSLRLHEVSLPCSQRLDEVNCFSPSILRGIFRLTIAWMISWLQEFHRSSVQSDICMHTEPWAALSELVSLDEWCRGIMAGQRRRSLATTTRTLPRGQPRGQGRGQLQGQRQGRQRGRRGRAAVVKVPQHSSSKVACKALGGTR